ncbi:MAG: hypothetical protein WCQ16_04135 [Verrucomicrobiae bacterium]
MRAMQVFLFIGGVSLCALLTFIAMRKPPAIPAIRLPDPGGKRPIGTTLVFLNDASRKRPIAAQVWYPRKPGPCGKPAPYFPFPEWEKPREFASVRTHGREGSEPAAGRWPVIICSPGWDGGSFENTTLCETLASAGFVVLALNHPGGSPLVKTPGGAIVTNENLERFDLSTEGSSAAFFRAAEREIDFRSGDVRFVIASLPAWNAGDLAGGIFRGKLDADHVGVLGYSFGGAVAAEVCRTDPRVKAGVNLDGNLFGKSRRSGSPRPFLFLTDNLPPPTESELRSADPAARRNAAFLDEGFRDYEYWREKSGAEILRIAGAAHSDFTDAALLTGPSESLGRINSRAAAFFEKTLREGRR